MVLVHTLDLFSSTTEWLSGEVELDTLLEQTRQSPGTSLKPKIRYAFLNKSVFTQPEEKRRELLRPFGVPLLVCTDFGTRCNGYFGSREVRNKAGQIQSYSTWLRCLVKIAHPTAQASIGYVWYEMTFFSRWESGHSLVFCVDTPDNFPSQLALSMTKEGETFNFSNPFALQIPLVNRVVDIYDQSVWGIRNLIRGLEKSREASQNIEIDFSEIHEISRHATHSTETLAVTTHSLEVMQRHHKGFHESLTSLDEATKLSYETTQHYLNFQAQLIQNLKLRSLSNQERLQSEITLAYNMITQKDSKIMMQIGEATKSDSSAMKTVAVVTMAFLPATFTSAVFGMNFFEFEPGNGTQPDKWRVSSEMWMFWVVAGLLTGLTIFAWLFWNRKRRQGFLFGPIRERRNLRRKENERAQDDDQ